MNPGVFVMGGGGGGGGSGGRGQDLAARRDALHSLRGPEGGYTRSHRGLASFWRAIADEVLVRPTPSEFLPLLTQLDDWLAGGPACALVVSADPGTRTALLARWALSIVERKSAEVIFVPVSPCFGTAVERDMLKLFFGLFRSSATAVFSRPRSPEELMLSIRMALRGVDSVSSVPNEECPQLLVIVDGIERAADGWPHRRMPFLGEAYDGAHILVSTSPESSSARGVGLLTLVSPEWLRIWMSHPGGLVGFTTDARRARYAAEDALIEACRPERAAAAEQERATLLCVIVRCALVEASLFAKEGSVEEVDYRTAPYVEPTVDVTKPTGAVRERAEALVTFASLLTGSEQQLVQGWATDACAGLDEILPRPIPHVTTDRSAADPERTRRIRAGATYDEVDAYLSRDMVIRPTDLSPDEAWRLAESREGESRMVSFAGILPDLSEEMRESAVREVMSSYWAHGDRLALRVLSACAPWMALPDAARVICSELGNDWTGDLPGMLVGFGSLTELSPLLQRLGGTTAIVGVARAIAEVGRWLP
ncbi:hypothetical protein ACSRUE_09115 [Sorangium sp. KYC3313]|uniref:hypothetical protein n=1 Tax=Sorangium sp. KYC3313 TaxID=3449740 RepID=UPI003F88D47C